MTEPIPRMDHSCNGDLGRRLSPEEIKKVADELGLTVSPRANQSLRQPDAQWSSWLPRKLKTTYVAMEAVRRALLGHDKLSAKRLQAFAGLTRQATIAAVSELIRLGEVRHFYDARHHYYSLTGGGR